MHRTSPPEKGCGSIVPPLTGSRGSGVWLAISSGERRKAPLLGCLEGKELLPCLIKPYTTGDKRIHALSTSCLEIALIAVRVSCYIA